MKRRGFTIVELMMVVLIIAVLAGLLLAVVSMIMEKRQRLRAATQINGLSSSVGQYMIDYGLLGDARDATSSDFSARPLFFLVQRPVNAGKSAYFDTEPWMRADANDQLVHESAAEVLLDPWGARTVCNITNRQRAGQPKATYDYTYEVELSSMAGSPDDVTDDVGKKWNSEANEWRTLRE